MVTLFLIPRHTAGLSWAYNTRPFFQNYHPNFNIGNQAANKCDQKTIISGYWILGASIGGGSFGVFAGGFFSDRVVSRYRVAFRYSWIHQGRVIHRCIIHGYILCDIAHTCTKLI